MGPFLVESAYYANHNRQGSLIICISTRYRVLYRPRHCDLVTQDGDDVTMVMEYWGARGGRGAEVERAVALRLGKGQTINDVQVVVSSYPVFISIMTIL